ncbi:hypothetical protein Mal4_38040 [Maioricimonas rarisocia]|uniref:Uncharacterized protein n=2 Tax=Maioricimonas rarisocia TaxID=2528026 RepID=A0A517ZAL2_9PLAN|nr:hypothetical protein Mal4_38040 [Maioricimonas rarisocia]
MIAILLTAASAKAQTSYPMLMSLKPVAAQIGATTEHELESRYSMFGAYDVLVTGEGVTGTIATPMELDKDGKEPSLTKIKLSFTVTADAQPGVRDFRIVGPTGASTLGQLVVTPDPVVIEQAKNDTPDLAQAIELPATVCGVIEKGEDVDYYRFAVAEPTTLNFHCLGMRLEDRIHDLQQHVDPILTVKNAATGSTVAAADNTYAADPFLSHEFAPGEYLLEVRDVRYAGNRYWTYAIEISSRPFVSHVHPFGITKGATMELETVAAPAAGLVSFTASMDEPAGVHEVRLPMGDGVTNPVPVVVSELPVVVEAARDNGTPETAQEVTFPTGISGRIESSADIDCFAFEAKKGDRISLEVVARRHWSGLDSIVRILNSDGKPLTENDDLRLWGKRTYQDSMIENWTVPADGRYIVELRDVHLRGGDEFVYYLKLQPAEPYFELSLDSDKTWLTPGTSAVIFARAVHKNGFAGEIQLHIDGLPEGVTASCGRILAGKGNDGCIILTAAEDAEMTASNIRVRGTAEHKVDDETTLALETVAQPMQETYMPGGGRNHWPVEMHTVAIGKPADVLDVTLSTEEVTLKPGESTTIDVEITRAEGFDKNVTLDMLFQHLSSKYAITLPEGVTIDSKNSKTLLTAKESKGSITLTAAANAPAADRQQCCVMANVSINFVMKATYSSPPLFVTVQEK